MSKIRNSTTEDSNSDSITSSPTKNSIWSSTDSEKSNDSFTSQSSCGASPDYSKDKFSPNTLGFLDDEIKRNASNIDNLSNVCKDDITKDSVSETLLEEGK